MSAKSYDEKIDRKYLYVCTCLLTHIDTHSLIHTRTLAHRHTDTHTHTRTQTHTHSQTHSRTYSHTHIHTHTHTRAYSHTHTHHGFLRHCGSCPGQRVHEPSAEHHVQRVRTLIQYVHRLFIVTDPERFDALEDEGEGVG